MLNLESLNHEQRQAVQHTEGPLLIFAGAGSGKTRVLTYRIAHLVESGLAVPEQILAVTFTNKAAGEMQERVLKLLSGVDISRLSVGTFHSICARILRREIHLLGFSQSFSIFDDEDARKLISNVVEEVRLSVKEFDPRSLKREISGFKNRLEDPETVLTSASGYRDEKIAEIYRQYQIRLKDNNALDFDDLLLKPLDLFQQYPDRLEWYQSLYSYVLVDEYQDTNRPQFEFIHRLTRQHRNICVVGDDDQSIYGWRGADIRNILEFESAYEDAAIIKLEQNYRSTRNILDAAHAVVANNEKRAEKKLWTENEPGDVLTVVEAADERGEAHAVLQKIQRWRKTGDSDLSSFVVLYRTNAQSRSMEDEFRRQGIPYRIVGGTKFYDRKEVKDILAYLRLMINPADNISLERIINFPARGIGSSTLEKLRLAGRVAQKPLFEVLAGAANLNLGKKQKDSLVKVYNDLADLRESVNEMHPDDFTRSLVERFEIIHHYENQDSDDARERLANIDELLNGIADYCEHNPGKDLNDFLEEVSLLTDIDNWNAGENAVTLMTLHSAKGLEFPVVFITGLENSLFPLGQTVHRDEELEEERRLFYVGVTRGMNKVYLTYARTRRRYGGRPNATLPSMFLDELPAELVQEEQSGFSKFLDPVGGRFDSRQKEEDSRNKSVEKEIILEGSMVDHKVFGRGKVLKIEGSGGNAKITIMFSGSQKKKFVMKYANLKPV